MQSFFGELLCCPASSSTQHSRSRSRSSGGPTPDRGRSGRSSDRHHKARRSRSPQYTRPRSSHPPSDHRQSHHSPSLNKYDKLPSRVQTDPVQSNGAAQYGQPPYGPTRRSTLPPYPERARLPHGPTGKPRSGFDPLANSRAYERIDERVHLRDNTQDLRTMATGRRTREGVGNPAPISTLGEEEVTERVADIRNAATARSFLKMIAGFWEDQLTEAEKHVAQKTFREDFKRTYPSERYPVLTSKPNISLSSLLSTMAHMLNVIRCSE